MSQTHTSFYELMLSSPGRLRCNRIFVPARMVRASKCIALTLCFSLSACTAPRYSFVGMGRTLDSSGNYDPQIAPKFSDALAINFADSVATLLRSKFTGARIADEVGRTAQIILAGLAGATAAFDFGASTVAALGLSSAAIPELQRIFNARGRSQVYQDAVRLIEEAEIEYLSFNQDPSDTILTQNGVTLFQRVTATIHVVEKTLTGTIPTVDDMLKATERMSQAGATRTRPGAPAIK